MALDDRFTSCVPDDIRPSHIPRESVGKAADGQVDGIPSRPNPTLLLVSPVLADHFADGSCTVLLGKNTGESADKFGSTQIGSDHLRVHAVDAGETHGLDRLHSCSGNSRNLALPGFRTIPGDDETHLGT